MLKVSSGSIAAFGAILALVSVVFLLARLAPQADAARWDVQDASSRVSCESQSETEAAQAKAARPQDYRSILFGDSERAPRFGNCK